MECGVSATMIDCSVRPRASRPALCEAGGVSERSDARNPRATLWLAVLWSVFLVADLALFVTDDQHSFLDWVTIVGLAVVTVVWWGFYVNARRGVR